MKPKKNAAPEVHAAYKEEKQQRALPVAGLAAITSVRQRLDERAETATRQLIVSGDGSYTNKTVLKNLPSRTTFIGRIRKDGKLYLPLVARDGATGRPRRYGPALAHDSDVVTDLAFPLRVEGRHAGLLFSRLYRPAHRSLCLRFAVRLTTHHARLEAGMVSLLLSRRALSSPTTCRFIPAHTR